MSRHRILLQTDPTWLKTGLAENAKTLFRYLWKTGKYDIAHYCAQGTSVMDHRLQLTPWKSFGCIPADQQLINQINADPNMQRNASYGAYNVDNVIKEWKPTIWIGSNDIWSHPNSDYCDKFWYNQINSVLHITVDSVPILDQAYDQAKRSKYYLTWAKFASEEMKRTRPDGSMNHVSSIYGAMDASAFSPIHPNERAELRKRFGIDEDAIVFVFVSRNQLRKQFSRILEGFAHFKRENPNVKAHLYFHTSFSEKGMGFDIPKIAGYRGLSERDILCTYVCRQCGNWWVNPYKGEDVDCPRCKATKSAITPNIVNGVSAGEMKYVYGIADAALQAHSSGGQELNACQALLCSKPLAITNYACGEDYCNEETKTFIHPLRYATYDEMGTSFFKSATDPKDVAAFMRHVARSSQRDLQEIGEKSRVWATKTFGIDAIGKQWETLFESMPHPEWSSIKLTTAKTKNADYPMPGPELSDDEFIQALYKHVLLMDERPDGEGQIHWRAKLKTGLSRDDVYRYFIQVAQQENAKIKPPQDFWSLIDKTTGRRRALFLVKESIGDCLVCTQLFESFHERYPNHDLYVMTDPKYAEVFVGNPHVFKVLPYVPQAENELIMIGAGAKEGYFHVYHHPCIATQRVLNYLSQSENAYQLT